MSQLLRTKNHFSLLLRASFLACSALLISQADSFADWILPQDVQLSSEANNRQQAEPNQWFCFRKQFHSERVPQVASVRIACDSKYWLWINGKIAVREGQLKRGPTPTGTYVDHVEIQDYLKIGENTVALLLWHFGKDGFSHNSSGLPGLFFESSKLSLASDSSWRSIRHPAFGDSKEPHPNYRLPESNVLFDARQDITGWTRPNYDDSGWPEVELATKAQKSQWGELTRRPIPQWRYSPLLDYSDRHEQVDESGNRTITTELPYNAQVHPYLKINASPGKTISIRTDNYRGGSEFNVRTEFITRDGVQEFVSPNWMNGHEVHYSLSADVEILELKYRESGYDTDLVGAFQCDDEFLNRLWTKSQRSLYVNMRDTYFDCPDRERAQWWGDVTLLLTESFYALDRRADRLTRKGILELTAWQRSDGTLFSPIPAGNWDQELPLQMLASVGRYGFWAYYEHSGDRKTIEQVYPQVKRYVLDVWGMGEDGLVVPRKGGWTWGDWGNHKDLPLLYNCWYYLALDGLGRMAALIEDEQAQQRVEQRMQSIEDNFHQAFWRDQQYRSPDYTGLTDDRGQALAVLCGLAKPAHFSMLRKVFSESRHASPYMEKYVLEALFQMGYPEDALTRMKDRYRPMVESPLTTLWEGWGIGAEGFGGGSYNHGWSGGPLILISQYVAGVTPLEPGYKRFEVKPLLATLKSVTSRMQTSHGEISLIAQQNDSTFSLELKVPEGTNARVQLPTQYCQRIKVDHGHQRREKPFSSNITKMEDKIGTGDKTFVDLPAGQWKIVGFSQ